MCCHTWSTTTLTSAFIAVFLNTFPVFSLLGEIAQEVVRWSWPVSAEEGQLCMCFLTEFSTLTAGSQPWWEYLYHGNWQKKKLLLVRFGDLVVKYFLAHQWSQAMQF
jgi:hypothetical protein